MGDTTLAGVTDDPIDDVVATAALHRRRFELADAEKVLRDALAHAPANLAARIMLGRVLLGAHREVLALAEFDEAARRHPNADEPLAWRIAALSRSRRYDDAARLGRRACDLFPRSAAVRTAVGRLALDQDQPLDALPHLVEATSLQPDDLTALWWRCRTLTSLYRMPEAEALARDALDRSPTAARAHLLLAAVLDSREQIGAAHRALDNACALDPDHPYILEGRVWTLRALHRYAAAEEASAEAIRRLPRCPDLHVERAMMYSSQDRDGEALAHVERALDLDPDDEWALENRIDLLCYLGRYGEAWHAAREALRRRPDQPALHLAAAKAAERDADADAHLDKALALAPRNVQALRDRVAILTARADFAEAERAARDAIAMHDYDPSLRLALAATYRAQRRLDEALSTIQSALDETYPTSGLLLEKGRTLLELGRTADATRCFGELHERFPELPGPRLSVAGYYSAEKMYDPALDELDEILRVNPCHVKALDARISCLYEADRPTDARRAQITAARNCPDNPDVLALISGFRRRDKEYRAALAAIDRALEIAPDRWEILRARCEILVDSGRRRRAVRAARQAIRRRPRDVEAHLYLGERESERGRHRSALAAIGRALEIAPNGERALKLRAETLLTLKRWDAAKAAFEDYLRFYPDDPEDYLSVAWEYSRIDRDDDAAEFAEQASSIDPQNWRILDNRVYFLRWAKRFGEARRLALAALDQHPDIPDLHCTIAGLYAHVARHNEAVTHAERALAIDPRNRTALTTKLDQLLLLRRYAEAREWAGRAIEEQPPEKRAEVLSAFAMTAYGREQYEMALTYGRRAIEASPHDVEPVVAYARLLTDLGMYRESLWWLLGVADDRRSSSGPSRKVGEPLAETFRAMGCRAKALEVGWPATTTLLDRLRRSANGKGLVGRLHRRAVEFDDSVLSLWEWWAAHTDLIETLSRPKGFRAAMARAECDRYILSWARRSRRSEVIRPLVYRLVAAAVLAGAWVVASLVPVVGRPAGGAGMRVLVASVAVGAGFSVQGAYGRLIRAWSARSRRALCTLLIGAISTIAGLLVAPAWQGTVVHSPSGIVRLTASLGLIVAGLTTVARWSSAGLVAVILEVRIGLFQRADPKPAALDVIFDLIDAITTAADRGDLNDRQRWTSLLERVAQHIERDLPRRLRSLDPATNQWLTERAAGAAQWVRNLKRRVILPGDDSWDQLLDALRSAAGALAGGDFALMGWSPPPRQDRPRRKRISRVIAVARLTVATFLPVAVMALIRRLLPVDEHTYHTGLALTIGWAVLYLLLSIDPTLREKIDTARNILGTVRETAKPAGADGGEPTARGEDRRGQTTREGHRADPSG